MNKLEIIEDTKKFYSKDPSRRAKKFLNSGAVVCDYFIEDKGEEKCCAVGRFLIDAESVSNNTPGPIAEWSGDLIFQDDGETIDDFLVDSVKGHPVDFWEDLQNLHDIDGYWDEFGLTEDGEEFYQSILLRWK